MTDGRPGVTGSEGNYAQGYVKRDLYDVPDDSSGYSGISHDASDRPRRQSPQQQPQGRGGGRAAARKAARKGGRSRRLKITAGVAVGLVLLGAGGAYGYYQHLNSQLSGSSLHDSGDAANAPKEIVDKFGRSPINILVMGSDSRTSKANCKIGGSTCGGSGGQRADVEMVLHVSADRSNATVLSIPRDLWVPLADCAGGGYNKINSALMKSPGCQVDTVEKLTGIPIDHFIMVDFSGVVAVSNAIGGVPVCVTHNIYDVNSGLKLSGGKHTLKGTAALQFLRTRDGFNDGSDVSRTGTQHEFLASALNQLEISGAISNPAKVVPLLSGVMNSLTVDDGPDGIKDVQKLASLAWDIHKVPAKRITFATIQTGQDSAHHLVTSAGAPALFKDIAGDVPMTKSTATPKPSASPSPAASVDPSTVAVTVANGTTKPGWAGVVKGYLAGKGFSRAHAGNSAQGQSVASTSITYPSGKQAQADAVAAAIGLPVAKVRADSAVTSVTLTLGADWTSGSTYPANAAKSSGAGDLTGASHQTAASLKGCAHVGNVENIPVGYALGRSAAGVRAANTPEPGTDHHQLYCGIGPSGQNCYATPEAAYALFPDRKDSDK